MFRAVSLRAGSFVLSIKLTNGMINSIRKIVIRVAQFNFTFIDSYRESIIADPCLRIVSVILYKQYKYSINTGSIKQRFKMIAPMLRI
ncbi:MAG: hypothetical protein A2Z38_08580 [Planctomycetes bacterium RBG_19FT_COMBO_48_8]|nr:MAG: hypothetical protein A2Z38_08580 [Planctomycetes bacterium RBG_19FT_COMBO_48_8]